MKNLAPFIVLWLSGVTAAAEVSIPLSVSATVPPSPCVNDGNACDSAHSVVASADTYAVVTGEQVEFVGSRPVISRGDGVTTLLF